MASRVPIDRELVIKLWEDAWEDGLFAAAWNKAVDGLTPEQAAWKPQAARHSIWQNVHHILFWREYAFRRIAGERPGDPEIAEMNWEEPAEVSGETWEATRRRFAESHQRILEALRAGEIPDQHLYRFLYHIPHDSYHIGQIMYLRAMLSLPPIE